MFVEAALKIFIFCHDSYMSGANKSLYDWTMGDPEDDFIFCFPHYVMKNPFLNLQKSKIYYGNFFTLNKNLTCISTLNFIKKVTKLCYMKLFKRVLKRRLKLIIEKEKPDLILSNSFSLLFGAEIAYELNIPHFWHIREFMELDHQISHYDDVLVTKLTHYSNAIYISDVIAEYYESKYKFKNSIVIYNQIHIPEFFNNNKELFTNGIIRIMIAGTLQENKGQKEAIKSVEFVHDKGFSVYLDIYGDGPQKKELNEYIQSKNLGNFIHLKGYSSKINSLRGNYDIELVCSTNEALGRVTVESMGCGCITIGADAGCTSKIISESNGLLYKLHDVKDLARKIIYAYENVEKMKSIRRNARKFSVENFSRPIYKQIQHFFTICDVKK